MPQLSPYEFGPLDYILPPLYAACIYAFPCPNASRDNVYAILEKAIDLLVQDHPLLAGHIVRDESPTVRPGTLRIIHDDNTRRPAIVRVDHDQPQSTWPEKYTYDWLRQHNMPPFALDALLLSPHAAGAAGVSSRPIEVQANFIDMGCIISFCASHALFDAFGLCLIMEAWAAKCRQLQGVSRNPTSFDSPGFDFFNRKLFKERNTKRYEDLCTRQDLWDALCLDMNACRRAEHEAPPFTLPAVIPAVMPDPELRQCVFKLDSGKLQRLKDSVSPTKDGNNPSIGDLITALTWRHVIRARMVGRSGDEKALMCVAINARNLSPKFPLPSSYPANSIVFGQVELPAGEVASSSLSLRDIALIVREKVSSVRNDTALISDAIELAQNLPTVTCPTIKLSDFLGLHVNSVNWLSMPFANIDFGPIMDGVAPGIGSVQTKNRVSHDGRPEFFRLPYKQFGGICAIMPRDQYGDVEFIVGMKAADMERLKQDKEFTYWCSSWTQTEDRAANL